MERRPLGNSGLMVSPVALGCWPIAGMTSLDVHEADSLATLAACFDSGVNFLDTAYCYGAHGESERLIARALRGRRHEMVIATKGGVHWLPNGERALDGSPATLRAECEESLRRLETDVVDLLYLHAPDPRVPVAESAGELRRLRDEGKTRAVGASNVTLAQLEAFAAECPLAAVQPPYNMLQRQIETDIIPWCQSHNVAVVPYWPLMKGLLAGKLSRQHVFQPGDGRAKYPMFQGEEWQRNQDFLDELRTLAANMHRGVAEIVVNWTMHQPGITAVLCGAKRSLQLQETARAMGWQLSPSEHSLISAALARRGLPLVKPAV